MIGACCSVVVWHAAVAIGCVGAFCRAAIVFGGCADVCCNATLFGASVVRAVSARYRRLGRLAQGTDTRVARSLLVFHSLFRLVFFRKALHLL